MLIRTVLIAAVLTVAGYGAGITAEVVPPRAGAVEVAVAPSVSPHQTSDTHDDCEWERAAHGLANDHDGDGTAWVYAWHACGWRGYVWAIPGLGWQWVACGGCFGSFTVFF